MTGRGVSDSDMLNFSRRARRDASGIPDAALAALLAGCALPADASAPLQHVADVLAALRAAPASDEAAGKAAALAQFRRRAGVSSHPIRSRRRRSTLLSSLLGVKAAVAAAVAVVGLGGVATAAYAGALPSSAQKFAHDTIGAPSPHARDSAHAGGKRHAGRSGMPVGPSASGPAAFGLCTAYQNAARHGTATQKAVAFRNLEKAAGGAANVASFCASVAHPGASATPHSGAPTSHPTGAPTSHPTGKPTSHPTGPPNHG
jgi:predicted nucleic acid-binding protein